MAREGNVTYYDKKVWKLFVLSNISKLVSISVARKRNERCHNVFYSASYIIDSRIAEPSLVGMLKLNYKGFLQESWKS